MGSRSGIFWEKIILGHKNQVEKEKGIQERDKRKPQGDRVEERESGGDGN